MSMCLIELEKILKEVPILPVPEISVSMGYDVLRAKGMAIQKDRKDDILKYTVINYNCDNIANTLLHETLHHYYPTAEEKDIELFTDFLWKDEKYKKTFQNKIVEVLGRYKL